MTPWVVNIVQGVAPTERTVGPFDTLAVANEWLGAHRADTFLRVQVIALEAPGDSDA